MRVVFVSVPAAGHLDPMMPLARELAAAGHEVTVATGPDLVERATRLGLAPLPVGPALAEAQLEIRRRVPGWVAAGGPEQWRDATVVFVDIMAPPMVAELIAALADRPPDLLIHDPCAYAGPLVARLLGIPSVCHHYSIPGRSEVAEHWGEAVAPLWDQWACSPSPLGGIYDYLVLGLCPPSLWDPDPGEFPTARRLRPTWEGGGERPEWLEELTGRPTVYVSFGTAYGETDVFQTVLEGLHNESLNVVVTVGARVDPEELRHEHPDVHVEGYVPQSVLLPHCDAVVCHAGSGTMLGALAHGLPLLCLPFGADHFFNAELCHSAGVARVLRPGAVTPEAVRGELRMLLDDPGYRARAATVRGEIDRMPAPAEWVQPLERLASERQPLVS
jgi:UDP:flavonoid glycosyltransferase YjiC (YdhE family)